MKIEYFASPEIKPLAQHSRTLGWYSEDDWECFLRTGVVFGHRLQNSEVVSSAYLSNFEDRVGWLGAVIVNSRFQGKKLGRDLIQKALSIAPDNDFVLALIATERGKKMYEQAGFVEIGNTHKFVANLQPTETEVLGTRKFEAKDFDLVAKLDSKAIGYSRAKLLRERLARAVEAFVFENDRSELIGYVVVSKDGDRNSVGPLVALEPIVAASLLQQSIMRGGAYRLDVPHWQGEFIRSLSELGFELERICPLLTYKGRPLPTISDTYFSIMAQGLG